MWVVRWKHFFCFFQRQRRPLSQCIQQDTKRGVSVFLFCSRICPIHLLLLSITISFARMTDVTDWDTEKINLCWCPDCYIWLNYLREMDISAPHYRYGSNWKIDTVRVFLTGSPGVLCNWTFINLLVRERSFHSARENIKTSFLFVFKLQCFTMTEVHLPITPSFLRYLSRLFARAQGFLPSQCSKDCLLTVCISIDSLKEANSWLKYMDSCSTVLKYTAWFSEVIFGLGFQLFSGILEHVHTKQIYCRNSL